MADATQNQLPKPADNPLLASVQGLSNLSVLRQIGVMLGLAATFAAVIAIFMWAQTPNYSLLYANLTEKDTTTIIDTLQQQGILYKLDPATGALMVPTKDLQSARLKLAAEGLPHSAGMGFETLREDSGFGTSQFLETARFQRSLEVELARSIANISNVETARVHLAIPKSSVFIRNRMKPSASVIVHLHSGRALEEDQVDAITHLVAFSVPELEADSVTVVDQKGRLLSGRKQSEQMAISTDQLDYAQKIEKSYMERIINILMPVVGPQGVQAQVTADVDFSVTEQTQELFNPDAPSLRSQQVAEESTLGATDGGVPGALSNQPPGGSAVPEKAGAAEQTASAAEQVQRSKRNSTSNYELDKTISHTRLSANKLRRLSVAVVVDDRLLANGERRPHTPEELERMTNLVKDAVGFDLQRGDSVSLTNASFSQPAPVEPLPEVPMWEQPWFWDVVKIAAAAIAIFAVIFGFIRPFMRSLVAHAHVRTVTAGGMEGQGGDQLLPGGAGPAGMLGGPMRAPSQQDKIQQMRSFADSEPQLVAEVLKRWSSSDEK